MATSGDLAESSQTAGVMTHSLSTVADALLSPEHLYRVAELRGMPTLIPQESGVYGWWFSKAPPGVPVDETAVHEGSSSFTLASHLGSRPPPGVLAIAPCEIG